MIEEHQEFHANNLLSFRASLTQAEMQKEMQNLEKFINDNNLTIVGPKISTTYSVSQGIVPTMDLEILVPISSLYWVNVYEVKSPNNMDNFHAELHVPINANTIQLILFLLWRTP